MIRALHNTNHTQQTLRSFKPRYDYYGDDSCLMLVAIPSLPTPAAPTPASSRQKLHRSSIPQPIDRITSSVTLVLFAEAVGCAASTSLSPRSNRAFRSHCNCLRLASCLFLSSHPPNSSTMSSTRSSDRFATDSHIQPPQSADCHCPRCARHSVSLTVGSVLRMYVCCVLLRCRC